MNDASPLGSILAEAPLAPRLEHYLDHWAAVTPSATAVIEGEARISYGKLRSLVDLAAARLRRQGIGPRDCVAVLAPPSVDFLVSFLATLRAGGTWLGINPKYTRSELAEIIRDAAPSLLLARPSIAGRDYASDVDYASNAAPGGARLCPVWWLERGDDVLAPVLSGDSPSDRFEDSIQGPPNDIAALVYTSGSTGKPKAARLPHAALIRAALVRRRAWPVSPLRIVNNLPINHVGGLGDIACTAIVAGGTQVFIEKFSPVATLEAINSQAITCWYQAPTMFELCLDAVEARDVDWSSLQAAIWSGGQPSKALVARLARIAPRLGVDYSMTESVGPITIAPLWDCDVPHDGHVGWPDPGRRIRLASADGPRPLRAGESGEVQIEDPWMFAGYRHVADNVDAFTRDGWFRTGDIAQIDPGGAWRLVGRSKEMFKSGGYNVYPREIERALEEHPQVACAAVVDVPDSVYGEVGVAFVVVTTAAATSDILRAHCRSRLANYKVPKRFEFVDSLPMLPIGKVDRVALRKRAATGTP